MMKFCSIFSTIDEVSIGNINYLRKSGNLSFSCISTVTNEEIIRPISTGTLTGTPQVGVDDDWAEVWTGNLLIPESKFGQV